MYAAGNLQTRLDVATSEAHLRASADPLSELS